MTPLEMYQKICTLLDALKKLQKVEEQEDLIEQIYSLFIIIYAVAKANDPEAMYLMHHLFLTFKNEKINKQVLDKVLRDYLTEQTGADINNLYAMADEWLIKAYQRKHLKAHLYLATRLSDRSVSIQVDIKGVDPVASGMVKAKQVLSELIQLMKTQSLSLEEEQGLKARIRKWFEEQGELMTAKMAGDIENRPTKTTAGIRRSLSHPLFDLQLQPENLLSQQQEQQEYYQYQPDPQQSQRPLLAVVEEENQDRRNADNEPPHHKLKCCSVM